ncbi:heavy metal translocating P-type ATPase, partial [Microbacterium sp. Leaf351]
RVLQWAAAVEQGSEHPVAAAIARYAAASVADLPTVTDFRTIPGRGAAGVIDGREVVVASVPHAIDERMPLPADVRDAVDDAAASGRSSVVLATDGVVEAVFTVADEVRPSAKAAVSQLQRMGLSTVLLTGDTAAAARRVADELGISEVRAEVMPADKAGVIAALQADGHRVAMVGDGINDAAALGTADLGMAVVSGTDIALKSADIILVRDDLRVIADAIALSRRTLRTIRGNLVWAFGYNVAAIPLAAAGLLNPLISAAAMSLSSVLVVWNSLRLRSAKARR